MAATLEEIIAVIHKLGGEAAKEGDVLDELARADKKTSRSKFYVAKQAWKRLAAEGKIPPPPQPPQEEDVDKPKPTPTPPARPGEDRPARPAADDVIELIRAARRLIDLAGDREAAVRILSEIAPEGKVAPPG